MTVRDPSGCSRVTAMPVCFAPGSMRSWSLLVCLTLGMVDLFKRMQRMSFRCLKVALPAFTRLLARLGWVGRVLGGGLFR